MTPSGTTQTPEQPDKEVEAALWRERCDGQILTTSGPQEVQRTRTSIAMICSKICSVVDTIQGADKELSDWASSLSGQADFFLEHLRPAELSSLVWTLEHLCLALEKCRSSRDATGALRVAVSQELLSLSGVFRGSDHLLSHCRNSGQSSSSFDDVCGQCSRHSIFLRLVAPR